VRSSATIQIARPSNIILVLSPGGAYHRHLLDFSLLDSRSACNSHTAYRIALASHPHTGFSAIWFILGELTLLFPILSSL